MSEAQPTEPSAEREWWDDPSMPWKHKPARADIVCFSWLGVTAIYSLVMLPLRPALLAYAPHVLASLPDYYWLLLGYLARRRHCYIRRSTTNFGLQIWVSPWQVCQ